MSAGCHSATPILTGDYAVEVNGQTVNVAKVMQGGSGYDMEWFDQGKWVPVTGPVKVLSKEDLGLSLIHI